VEDVAAAGFDAEGKSQHAAEQHRPDVAEARAAWRASQPDIDASRLVFIDETWTKTNMARTRGRAPKGQRLVAYVPHGIARPAPSSVPCAAPG